MIALTCGDRKIDRHFWRVYPENLLKWLHERIQVESLKGSSREELSSNKFTTQIPWGQLAFQLAMKSTTRTGKQKNLLKISLWQTDNKIISDTMIPTVEWHEQSHSRGQRSNCRGRRSPAARGTLSHSHNKCRSWQTLDRNAWSLKSIFLLCDLRTTKCMNSGRDELSVIGNQLRAWSKKTAFGWQRRDHNERHTMTDKLSRAFFNVNPVTLKWTIAWRETRSRPHFSP